MMTDLLLRLLTIIGYCILGVIAWLALVRVVRHFYKFPMPQFMANLIDNPLRRKVQPPDELAIRHGIEPGMTVLDVGPGNGTYTLAAARRVGPAGKIVAIDIEPKMIERVQRRVQRAGAKNIEARLADVYALPFDTGALDAAYMITVIGEIPEPERAMREIRRALKPTGTLSFSELFIDPDYPLASTTIRRAQAAGFQLKRRFGGFFSYTLMFEKNQDQDP
jgi:ubiquinone/menaquinone biosynthesis C-methylase UbiE